MKPCGSVRYLPFSGAPGFRGGVGVAANFAHAEDGRRRAFHHLNAVHRGEHAARVALQGKSAHAAKIGISRNITNVDSALDAKARRGEDAGDDTGQILDCGK